jgi:sugar-specific transcriptional regulator TrmB
MDNNDYIKKRKDELDNEIRSSEDELKELRKMCRHSDVEIKNINRESGASQLRRVCKVCGEAIGFPSNDELRDNGYMPKNS